MLAEQVTGPVAYHGEGPVWSPSWGGLRWLDMLAGDILSFAPDGQIERRHVARVVAAIRPRAGGGMVIGVERGFALMDAAGALTTLDELWHDDDARMNEGACDPDGRFYCGSMAYDLRSDAGALCRLAPDGSVQVALAPVTEANGLDWSPDGSRAYFNDTPTFRVTVFDYDREAGLTAPRPLVAVPPEAGRPDGLTVDAEGGVWVALNGGGAVRRYTPEGALDAVVEVPTPKVTACTFGGPLLEQLFITTSRDGVPPGADQFAGSLFRVIPGVAGQPARAFAG